MSSIEEFIVVQPPTGEEVRYRALEALNESRVLTLVIKGTWDVPEPEAIETSFLVERYTHTKKGDVIIEGTGWKDGEPNDESHIVRLSTKDPSRPGKSHIVRA